jgi:hypothetical protein
MAILLIRLGVLALIIVLVCAIVWLGQSFVARQRRLALAAVPLEETNSDLLAFGPARKPVRILAFSSADCSQCHTYQLPALRRLEAQQSENIDVLEIDATNSPELAKRYHVLTVPSTVLLDQAGAAYVVNYGFANLKTLQQQVEKLLIALH